MTPLCRSIVALAAGVLMAPVSAPGQALPARPIDLGDGRLVIGGEISASISKSDRPGYFNYTDYEHSALRLFRLAVSAAWQPADRLAFLAELVTENAEVPRAYAAYVRLRPWLDRPIDIQLGRIPPSFGAFGRRSYGADTLLPGYPLAYQYLTNLRPDALPASTDDLLRQRGRGWLVSHPIGRPGFRAGVPLIEAFRWDTGVQVHAGRRPVEITGAVTTGTLSNPGTLDDDNGGRQFAGRVTLRPVPGLVIGLSGSSGRFVARVASDALPAAVDAADLTQRAWGADLEYSRGHWLVRGELVVAGWRLPAALAPRLPDRLWATGAWMEGRYRITPRVYVAGRLDRLSFSRVTGTLFGGRPTTWDAPVTRAETGVGYYLQRNVIARVAYQHNWRDGGRPTERGFVAAQVLYWF